MINATTAATIAGALSPVEHGLQGLVVGIFGVRGVYAVPFASHVCVRASVPALAPRVLILSVGPLRRIPR